MRQNFLLKKEKIHELLSAISKEMKVFVPCKNENNASCFQSYSGQELFLEKKTYFSVKKTLSPALEKEFFFRKKSSSVDIEHFLNKEQRMLFAVRACDTHAIKALDALYLDYFTEDPFYKALRENTLIVALQCSVPCSNGFCQSLGTDKPIGHDILLVEKENSFFVEPVSEKGKALVEKFREFFNTTSFAKPVPNFKCNKELNTSNLKEILDHNFSHPKWGTEAEKCLSCTLCTQICPSCYCFLTFDKFVLNSENSERFREWDSCQLQRFTGVAGNHFFRSSRTSRLRQFVMHKLSYFQENHEMMLCVGCGRCIDVCPVGIDLTEIASAIRSAPL